MGLKLYTAPDPASQTSTQQMSETPIQPDLLISLQVSLALKISAGLFHLMLQTL